MKVEALAAAHPYEGRLAVPSWTLGCFRRRSITYANGVEDDRTRVIWIQSHGLTGDIRIPANRPRLSHRRSLRDCSRDELAAVASAEGGVADTAYEQGRMSWSNWAAFQPYDKWPEPGELRRVGPCLVEFAPSGAYVEDWRLESGAAGLLVGLRLLGEARGDGPVDPRDGGLVIAGDHAIHALGRRAPLPSEAPLSDQLREADDLASLAAAVFDAQTRYARRDREGRYRVELATDPFAEGGELELDGFAMGDAPGRVVQTIPTQAGDLRRFWRVDTLVAASSVRSETESAADGAAWLAEQTRHLPGLAPALG